MASIAWHNNQQVQLASAQSDPAVLLMLKTKILLDFQDDFPEIDLHSLTKFELRDCASLQWVRFYLTHKKVADEEEPPFGKELHLRCMVPKVIGLLLPKDLKSIFFNCPRQEQLLIVTKIDILLETILESPYCVPFFNTCFYSLPEKLLVSMQKYMLSVDHLSALPLRKKMAQIREETTPILQDLAIVFEPEGADFKEAP
jgi:hypothetical protein